MLKIAVCDDDFASRKNAEELIARWEQKPEGTLCEVFENGDDLIKAHKNSPFDIILLDILMPMFSGIEAAREIRQSDKNTKIIFLTSSPEFALESYSVRANNYLLKPVDEKALFECLDEFSAEEKNSRTIAVKGVNSVRKISTDEIVYLEAQNKRIVFSLLSGSKIETTEPLHLCEEKLSGYKEFFKCHRSYIVNINHIDKYTSKEVKMHNGCVIPISRRFQKALESAYFAVLFGEAGADKW